MDYQFILHSGKILAKCSMGHEAVAAWLNSEVRSDPTLVSTVLEKLHQAQTSSAEIKLVGKEYGLFINADEVMIRANNLDIESQESLDDDFHYYDSESIAFCGLEDFERFLQSYLAFQGK